MVEPVERQSSVDDLKCVLGTYRDWAEMQVSGYKCYDLLLQKNQGGFANVQMWDKLDSLPHVRTTSEN